MTCSREAYILPKAPLLIIDPTLSVAWEIADRKKETMKGARDEVGGK